MAFILDLTPTYRKKVIVEVPNNKGGIDKSEFTVEFKRVPLTGDDNQDEGVLSVDDLRNMTQLEVLRYVVVGWDGLLDKARSDVPFNTATLAALLSIPHAVFAMADAFWTSIYKAKEKN